MKCEGDDYLSGWDNKLWETVFYVLIKYGIPIRFKFFMGDCRENRDSDLHWFVPMCQNFEVVEHFLLKEYEKDIFKGHEVEFENVKDEHDNPVTHYSMGMRMEIFPISFATLGYVEREQMESMSIDFAKKLKDIIDEMKDKDAE